MYPLLERVYNKIVWELRGRRIEKKYRERLKNNIRNEDFSIISNNCWGGNIYGDLGIEYKTPTAGLFFNAPCFVKFLKNLKENLNAEIVEVKYSRYDNVNKMREETKNYFPIGLINNDIEIDFLHYRTMEEAVEKWKRRSDRVNFDNLLIAMSDTDNCTSKEIEEFDELHFEKKIFFSSKPYPHLKSVLFFEEWEHRPTILPADKAKYLIAQKIDLQQWISGKDKRAIEYTSV
ncbi:DUF1919 domain-containing protein [Niabella drilacis]|uniref:Uncharacterized protein, DUF1919 family n=1 Tax=Niabella drilacis (strain DSM 25811 / CCM 8410 / CCUG 62505 / LMG 26954 / E90) TaxID=1285928 RepID=A0A1G6NPW3_NIADE|nr:DUF1919 domain-containing protein [Niabella drilacis]SDC70022.1 Uncharacterized protein, DUF1919 family [Niabella drilacis]